MGLTGVAGSVGLTVLLHLLRPDLDPLRFAMSQYTLGPYGWLMHLAFGCLVIGVAALAVASRARRSRVSRHAAGALGVAAAGAVVASLFETDPIGTPDSTPVSYVHEVGVAVGLLGVVVAQLAVAVRGGTPRAARIVGLSRALLISLGILPLVLLPLGVGAAQRTAALLEMVWLAAWAIALWPGPEDHARVRPARVTTG